MRRQHARQRQRGAQEYQRCIGHEAEEAAAVRLAHPEHPHMEPLPLRQRAAVGAAPFSDAQRSLEIEHAWSQLICRTDDFHEESRIAVLPA